MRWPKTLPFAGYILLIIFHHDLTINKLSESMRPRRSHRKEPTLEESDSVSSINQQSRPRSTQDIVTEIRELKRSMRKLQSFAHNQLLNLENMVKKDNRKIKRTAATNSEQSGSEYYNRGLQKKPHIKSMKTISKESGLSFRNYNHNKQRSLENQRENKSVERPNKYIQKGGDEDYSPVSVQPNKMQKNKHSTDSNYEDNALSSNKSLAKYKSRLSKNFQTDTEKLDWVRSNIVGFNTNYVSAFELELEAVYVDHTATNRPFKTVEAMVSHAKLFTANPHTEYSQFGKICTQLVHYSLVSLLSSFSADPNKYLAIPAGSGSTGALRHTLDILKNRVGFRDNNQAAIIVTPYEHHSNILPWSEVYGKVEILANDNSNSLILPLIKEQILKHPKDNLVISVSATSNVTSKVTNLNLLNEVIKQIRQKATKNIVFTIDCAAYCCHRQFNLKQLDQVDFAFLSPHKNLGGAESCGVLLLRRSFIGDKPTFPGGGTIVFVSGYTVNDILYSKNDFEREIPGTPPFFGFYRAALSFQLLKETIGYKFIHEQQRKNTQLFFKLMKQANALLRNYDSNVEIKLYGDADLEKRANVVSLNIITEKKTIFYFNLLGCALADIFGIQVRSGCFCAGPYSIDILQIQKQQLDMMNKEIATGKLQYKPGFIRLDLSFYLKEFEVKYIVKSLFYLAKHHQNIEQLYDVVRETGKVNPKKKFNFHKKLVFELKQVEAAEDKLHKHEEANSEKLKNRRLTLENQLRMGKSICQHPEDYLQ